MNYTVDLFQPKQANPKRVASNTIEEVLKEVEATPVYAIALNRVFISTPEERTKVIELLNKINFKKNG